MIGSGTRFRLLVMPLAGAFAVTAFAPFGWFPVVCLSLALLFNQWLTDTPRRAFLHGGLFGLGFFGAGVSWVYVSVHGYGHVPAVAAIPVTLLLVAFMSLFPAFLGLLLRRYCHADSWLMAVAVLPAGWILAEWLRGWLFSGFPWLNIGNSQIDGPLAGYAPLLGVYGTGWAAALTAGLLVMLLRRRLRVAGLLLLTAIWGGGHLLGTVEWTQPRAGTLKVALVQGNIPQEEKWAPENMLDTLTRYVELTFAQTGTDIVVWPETAIPAFLDQVQDNFIPYIEKRLEAADMSLLTGIPVLDRTDWRYYNAVMSLGGKRALYYKQHLVPYGEYLPLRWLIGNALDALAVPNADFSRGAETQPLLQAAGYPVGASICFEVVFGEQIIRDLPEAALLVNVSNDAWFGDSLAPHQHLEMARMRARETGRPMLRATNTGISAIIDHRGQVTARSPQFEQYVVSGSIVPRQGATPYVMAGNAPVVVLCLLCVLLPRVYGRLKHAASRNTVKARESRV
ncbi:MAG: apolipoprotein N-acyltransferase [Gammaproteobacteria bacterium]|jgi:apolipoprotein N-acyltransferase